MNDELILGMIGVVAASVCIWLTVRIVNWREREAIIVAVLLAIGGALLATIFYLR